MAKSTSKKPTSENANEATKVLSWLRANRFLVVGVTVGDVTITCQDGAPLPAPRTKGKSADGPSNLYEEFGGSAWTDAQKKAEGPAPGSEDEGDDDEV